MLPDYYRSLKIPFETTREEIKRAYRKCALEFHPDKCSSPDAHEKFISINEAYLILYDPEAREKYDVEYRYFYSIDCTVRAEYNSIRKDKKFDDEELNDWSEKARKQGAEFSEMSYENFSNLVKGIVKETGFQFGNTILVFLGIILTLSGCGNLIIGLSTGGDAGNPFIGIIMLPLGFLLWRSANKNWEKH